MRIFTAVIVVFTLVCSGSFGMEDVVSSSGPGFTHPHDPLLPFVWSVPMAFVSSELGSVIPEGGGLYRWMRRAMGEYWSFQTGWWWTPLALCRLGRLHRARARLHPEQVGHERQLALAARHRPSWRCSPSSTSAASTSPGKALTVIQVIVMVPFVVLRDLGHSPRVRAIPFRPSCRPARACSRPPTWVWPS